jgi:MFS family permease
MLRRNANCRDHYVITTIQAAPHAASGIDSTVAWMRLGVALWLGTVGSVGMWSFVVLLPAVQADFGIGRGEASLAYTLTMFGFGFGGIIMGRLADRFGIVVPLILGALALGAGYGLSSLSGGIVTLALTQALLGLGAAATFGPLMADISHWFVRRRGIAVAISSCGNYLAGVIWPPFIQHFIETSGWRATQLGIGVICMLLLLPFVILMRRPPPTQHAAAFTANAAGRLETLGISANTLLGLLFVAGIACCVAMSMPQVHIVAYCGDLGYGVTRGAEMLSLMLGFGIISRIGSGFLADKIGGIRTLLIGSVAQGSALLFYLFFDSLTSLYIISAMFGLFQGGIVPSYAIIVREAMPAAEAATRVGIVILASVFGMSLGGWISGVIFDATGSYAAAFLNGLGWNALNITIMVALLIRARQRLAMAL